MSRIADEYGLDVWIWYPAMDPDYSDPETVEFALKEWGEVFRRLPRIDAVFVPGGDPGHTRAEIPDGAARKADRESCTSYHPKAQMWMSPQGFTAGMDGRVLGIVETEPGLADRRGLRAAGAHAPAGTARGGCRERYPIRYYPDITHSLHCAVSRCPTGTWRTR